MTIAIEKSRARLQAKQRRLKAHHPARALELLAHYPALKFHGLTIGGIWPLPGEIDTRPLQNNLAAMGETLSLPCTPKKGHPLTFRAWSPGDKLKVGPYQTREPYPDQAVIYPDLVFVPLLAFTRRGERLGYGGGFYDRTLQALRQRGEVFACGIAYNAQEAVTLPTDKYDVRLDAILTETGFRTFNHAPLHT